MSISLGVSESKAQRKLSGKRTDASSMAQPSKRKMRRIGMSAVVTLFVALAALIPVAVRAWAQSAAPAPNSYALGHSVVVIGPNSPMFDTLLERWFPGVTGVNNFKEVKPLLAIVHNNSKRPVVAYVVKWTITNADSSTSTEYLTVVQAPVAQWTLTGQRTILGPAGTGAGTQLVSPWFHWPRSAFPSLLKVNAVMISFQVANTEAMVSSVQRATQIQTALDGATFGDGVFIGPDTSKLYERLQAAQEAEVDEGAWMLNLLRSGPSIGEIEAQLGQQIYDGFGSAGVDPEDLYQAARGRAAQRLLRALKRGGQGRLQNLAHRLATAKRPVLEKLARG